MSAIGMNYTFLVDTNYTGSDIWGYEFELLFDPDVLHCVDFANGELITEDTGLIEWRPGTINNTVGTLSVTGCTFWAPYPTEPAVTSGPGTLANVTFEVVGYGISNITFGDDTRLMRWHLDPDQRNIISEPEDPEHIGDGIIYNLFPGDMTDDTPGVPPDAPDGDVDEYDLGEFADAYGTSYGQPDYNDLGDLTDDSPGVLPNDPDGDIDVFDLFVLADNYGSSI